MKWIKVTPSLKAGIDIVNKLENAKFEQFLNRIFIKVKNEESEIFTEDELDKLQKVFKIEDANLTAAIKTIANISKRLLKFIFMPVNLKEDLKIIGLDEEKIEAFVKVWSNDTKSTIQDVLEHRDDINFSWKLNAELSSDVSKKSKVPKLYLSLSTNNENVEVELEHQHLYSTYLSLERLSHELDNLAN